MWQVKHSQISRAAVLEEHGDLVGDWIVQNGRPNKKAYAMTNTDYMGSSGSHPGSGQHGVRATIFVVCPHQMVETLVGLKKSGLSFKSEKGYWGRQPEPRTPGEMI